MITNPPNPYMPADDRSAPATHHAESTGGASPYLDDAGPVLQQTEAQRINRKALLFLGGIVGLLVLMAIWMFARATSKDADKAIRPPSEVVQIPELPETASPDAAAGAAAVPLASDAGYPGTPEPLPPLPAGPDPMPAYAAGPPPPGYGMPAEPLRPPSLLERRMGQDGAPSRPGSPQEMAAQAMLAGMHAGYPAASKAEASPTAAVGTRDGARYLGSPDTLLVRGTYIRCVLETRIVSEVEGFTSCIVTEPVYSINGRSLLLPKGSKVLGRYAEGHDGPRVEVVWDRITTPHGIDMTMSSPGVDALGSAGHPGHYDAHWPNRIASALLISLIADGFGYAAAKNGPPSAYTNGDLVLERPFQSKTAESLERVAQQAIAAGGRRRPTVTINQGTVVNVYVAKDIDFSNVIARR